MNTDQSKRYLEELNKCVRCGSCKALCPIYDDDPSEAMGPRGRIALLWGLSMGELKPSAVLNERIFSCILCGACSESCPPGVDIKEAIYHGRSLLRKSDKKRQYLRSLTKFSAKRPQLIFRFLRLSQYILFPYLSRKGLLSFQPDLPENPLRERNRVYTVTKKKGRVAVFTGCIVNFLYSHLGESLINVLQGLGYEVILPGGEACCGVPLRTLGLEEEAMELARRNVRVFSKLKVKAVLSLCPSCITALKFEYPKLIGEGLEKAMDMSSFLIDELDTSRPSHLNSSFTSAAYHHPCHLNYGLGIKREPREIVKKAGIDLIDTEGGCCGFGGLFSISCGEVSERLLEKRIKEYADRGVETIISDCPGCIIQLKKGFKNKSVLHLIEVIEKAYLLERGKSKEFAIRA
ncbi:MAG: (Fe-S)-binding protein [Nitrospirota bacterium]